MEPLVLFRREVEQQNNDMHKQSAYQPLFSRYTIPDWCPVDFWRPAKEDIYFSHAAKAIIAPIAKFYQMEGEDNLNLFIISKKRCYNKSEIREHTVQYLNYFCKFYDQDLELLSAYATIKYCIDKQKTYNKQNLKDDINLYILKNPSLTYKVKKMVIDNNIIDLNKPKGNSKKVESLHYNTAQGKILMQMSFLINAIFPLVLHYAYTREVDEIDYILLEFYDDILHLSYFDVYNKFYETSRYEVRNNINGNKGLWNMQAIRGISPNTHIDKCIDNIILNIMAKFVFKENLINLIITSIRNSHGYNVIDIKYECNFNMISSSNRDEDFNSDMDKFESFLVRQNEALYIQSKYSSARTMETIEELYGPFSQEEIDFYINNLEEYIGGNIIHSFQQELLFNHFYKFFGEPNSIEAINKIDYIKLMIAAKRMCSANTLLPYIFSSKIVRMPQRKSINKKDKEYIQASPLWKEIQNKYRSESIEEYIFNMIAIIISTTFRIIDFDNEEIHGKELPQSYFHRIEEMLKYFVSI